MPAPISSLLEYEGTGIDTISGGKGDDYICAEDGQVDHISCGGGTDTVHFDGGIHYVSTNNCERRNPPHQE